MITRSIVSTNLFPYHSALHYSRSEGSFYGMLFGSLRLSGRLGRIIRWCKYYRRMAASPHQREICSHSSICFQQFQFSEAITSYRRYGHLHHQDPGGCSSSRSSLRRVKLNRCPRRDDCRAQPSHLAEKLLNTLNGYG